MKKSSAVLPLDPWPLPVTERWLWLCLLYPMPEGSCFKQTDTSCVKANTVILISLTSLELSAIFFLKKFSSSFFLGGWFGFFLLICFQYCFKWQTLDNERSVSYRSNENTEKSLFTQHTSRQAVKEDFSWGTHLILHWHLDKYLVIFQGRPFSLILIIVTSLDCYLRKMLLSDNQVCYQGNIVEWLWRWLHHAFEKGTCNKEF